MTDYAAAIRDIPRPDRIARLPVSAKGFPIPWFVATIEGVPDFRVIGRGKMQQAWRQKLCWVCGAPLGRNLAMTLGPMCLVNRTISEPPAHKECAVYSCLACPFLSNPAMRRHEAGLPEDRVEAPGFGIKRNPGAMAVWMTRGVRPFRAYDGSGTLFTFDDPTEVLWFSRGREATRDEVLHSINTGLPILQASAEQDGPEAVAYLQQQLEAAMKYLPA